MTTTDGIYIDNERVVDGDTTGPQSAQVVLGDPAVDAAVLETAREMPSASSSEPSFDPAAIMASIGETPYEWSIESDVLAWGADRDPAHLARSDVEADLEAERVAVEHQRGRRVSRRHEAHQLGQEHGRASL